MARLTLKGAIKRPPNKYDEPELPPLSPAKYAWMIAHADEIKERYEKQRDKDIAFEKDLLRMMGKPPTD